MIPRPRRSSAATFGTAHTAITELVARVLYGPPLSNADTAAIRELLNEFPHLQRRDR